jgi:hypothetical protein
LLLLSYPENRNAYVPFSRELTSDAFATEQFLGFAAHPVGSRVEAADIWIQLPLQLSCAV